MSRAVRLDLSFRSSASRRGGAVARVRLVSPRLVARRLCPPSLGVSLQYGRHQRRSDLERRSPKRVDDCRQVQQAPCRRFVQHAQCSDHGQSALLRRPPRRAIIQQHEVGVDLNPQTDYLAFAGMEGQGRIVMRGLLNLGPRRQGIGPSANRRRCVLAAQFRQHRRRDNDPLKQPRQDLDRAAENQVVQRTGIRDDDGHWGPSTRSRFCRSSFRSSAVY